MKNAVKNIAIVAGVFISVRKTINIAGAFATNASFGACLSALSGKSDEELIECFKTTCTKNKGQTLRDKWDIAAFKKGLESKELQSLIIERFGLNHEETNKS